jgi:sec-independent protein translocase protein TatA
MPFNLGAPEMLIILLVVILLFGASRLPELAKSVGVSMKEFKKAAREVQEPDETESKST